MPGWLGTIPFMRKRDQAPPVPAGETWSKITVVLLDRHVAYLDRIAVDIRLQKGIAISRAELIRGLIEAASKTGVTLSDATSNPEMVNLLRIAWARGGTRKRR
jgi:hypothetical protein